MQTTTPITDPGGARGYFEKDDYYTRDGSGNREWIGKGSEALGLDKVDPDAFQAILEGKDLKGNTLVFAASNGEHRAGWDLHFAPSKSISVLWAFGSDQQRQDMIASHHAAVESTMRYVEDNLIEARTTQNHKTSRVVTGNLVAARFDHFSSRELDPQLHSHVVVANMTQRPDGNWRAIANEKIFNRELLTALYENELAVNLKERGYSVAMEKHETGNSRYATIEGIDQKIIDHFGKRQAQIDQAMKRLEERYPEASRGELRQMACLDTRQTKQIIDKDVLHDSWNRQLEGLGIGRDDIAGSVKMNREEQLDLKPSEYETIRTSCRIINEQESTFTREDVLKMAARISAGNHRNNDLERAFNELKGSTIVSLDKISGTYTTKEMRHIERGIVSQVRNDHDAIQPVLTVEQAEGMIAESYNHLTKDQQNALTHILTASDRIIGIQGDAGTGKTTMLSAARQELEKDGFRVRGLSFTGKAANELEIGAGVDSKTIHSFLPQTASPQFAFSEKEAWFVDEVSMVGSKQMNELIKASKKANARLVFVGDTKQLQSIDAGKMFHQLQEKGVLNTLHMKETIRQNDKDYRGIVEDIAQKKLDSAFDKLAKHKKIHEIPAVAKINDAIVRKVESKKDYRNVLVVTPLNKDRNEINKKIRDNLKDNGKINGQEHLFRVREYRNIAPSEKHFTDSYNIGDFISTNGNIKGVKVGTEGHVVDKNNSDIIIRTSDGKKYNIDVSRDSDKIKAFQEKTVPISKWDRIVFLKNDRPIKVQNGLTGEVRSIDERGNIVIAADNKRDISFNIKHSYNYLDHGYAVTDYKSQGQTSKEVIYLANTEKNNSYNSFYVGLTRGKDDIHVYTDNADKLKKQVHQEVFKTSTLDHDQPHSKGGTPHEQKQQSVIEKDR